MLVKIFSIAQAPPIQWDKTIGGIGGNSFNDLRSLQQTTDGGYILGGTSAATMSGDKSEDSKGLEDYWVVKLDANGIIQWDKTIGGNNDDYFSFLQQTSDGGYILGGSSSSGISGDKSENSKGSGDYWVVKLDANGLIQWNKTIGGNSYDNLSCLRQTSDGGYILGGSSESSMSGDKSEDNKGLTDYWVVKVDANGAIQWNKTIGGNNHDFLSSLQQTSDGGYILGGKSSATMSGDKSEDNKGLEDYWVVKLDANGTIQWDKTIGGNSDEYFSFLQQTGDGGYILGGTSASAISGDKSENSKGDADYWVVKLDGNGTIQWNKTIGGNNNDLLATLQQTNDGGYIVGGTSESTISGDKSENSKGSGDYWVVKLDANGAIQWNKTIGGNNYDRLSSFQQISDGGYIVGGTSGSPMSGDKSEYVKGYTDYWVVKLGEAPSATVSCRNSISVYTDEGKYYAVVNDIDPIVSYFNTNNVAYPNEVAILNPDNVPPSDYANVNYKIEKGRMLIEQGTGTVSGKQFTTGVNTVTYSLVDEPSQICTFTIEVKNVRVQAPPIQWDKTIGGIGGNSFNNLRSIQQTTDGGYILGGTSAATMSGDKSEDSKGLEDYWVVKLDANGIIQWDKTIGGNNDDYFSFLQQTSDGGYILGGSSSSTISGDKSEDSKGSGDYWVVKLDANGAIQWNKTIGGNSNDYFSSLQQTSDGGYILGGTSASAISGDKSEDSKGGLDYWVIKLNANGAIQWNKTIGGNSHDYFSSVQQTSDGGYILGGYSEPDISAGMPGVSPTSGDKSEDGKGGQDYWVVKLDATGAIQWDKTIGGNSHDLLSSLQQTNDGGYILGGTSASLLSGDKSENSIGLEDYWVLKLDATGAIQWDKTIGGNSHDYFSSLQQTSDGGYIVGGTSASAMSGDKSEDSKGNRDYWVAKLDANGAIQWDKTIGGNNDDLLSSFQKTSDGWYVAGGTSGSPMSGDKSEYVKGISDFWVVKLGEGPSVTLACPNSISVNADEGKCYAVVNGIDPNVSSTINNIADPNEIGIINPDIVPAPVYSNVNFKIEKNGTSIEEGTGSVSGKQFTTGITTVTYTLIDDPSQSCSFFVEVKDEEEPVIKNYPTQLNLCFNSSGNYIIPPINPSDNCGLAYVEYKIYSIPYVIDENGVLLTERTGSGYDASGSFYVTESRRDFVISWYVEDVHGNSTSFATNVHINNEIITFIGDVFAVNPGGMANTIYLGYGPSSLTLVAEATGGNLNYTYNWSTGDVGSSVNVSPNAAGANTYTVTVTDATGCTSSATKTVTVVDIRSDIKKGKIWICHRDLKGKRTTLSVLAGSVAEHLAHGDYLGQCVSAANAEAEITTQAAGKITNKESQLITQGIRLFPNPADKFLNIEWSAKTSATTSINIIDVQGRVIKKVQAGVVQKDAINRRTISLVGLAKGVYLLELRAGADIQVSRFVIQ